MSQFLSVALGEKEARFNHALMAEERRSGHPNHDLRLSSKVMTSVRQKLSELGLDPDDTTPEELYHSLNHKLAEQDSQLNKEIRTLAAQKVNAEANLTDGIKTLIGSLDFDKTCFCLKPSVLKRQLKAMPPKKVMKVLSYRSVDSMLKIEPMPLVLLAINSFESEAYLTSFYAKYKKYTPSDFELRQLSLLTARNSKWQELLKNTERQTGLTVVSAYETASIVILPVNNSPESGHLTVILASLVNELSTLLSVSSYLKVHQVRADFGPNLMNIVEHEPYLDSRFLGHPLSWQTSQHILSSSDTEEYAPHMSANELDPPKLMDKLAKSLDEFRFWQDNQFLGLVKSSEATSLNVLDVATNLVNKLPFSNRQLNHFRRALRQELTKLYVTPESVIDSLTGQQETEISQDSKVLAG